MAQNVLGSFRAIPNKGTHLRLYYFMVSKVDIVLQERQAAKWKLEEETPSPWREVRGHFWPELDGLRQLPQSIIYRKMFGRHRIPPDYNSLIITDKIQNTTPEQEKPMCMKLP